MGRTSTTANALLGLLGIRPSWTSAELAAQLGRNLRFFWPRAESRTYAALTALEADGLVRAVAEPIGPRRSRTRYAITTTGRRQLQGWLATPPRSTALECEPLLRVLLGHLGTHEQLAGAIERIRLDAQGIREVGRAVGQEYSAGVAPFQDHIQQRALVFDFLTSWSSMLDDWAERSSQTVASWPAQSQDERQQRALHTIRTKLAELQAAPCASAEGSKRVAALEELTTATGALDPAAVLGPEPTGTRAVAPGPDEVTFEGTSLR